MISGIHIQGMPLIICYQYKSIYRKCFNNDMQYLVMCSKNIVRDNPKSLRIVLYFSPLM